MPPDAPGCVAVHSKTSPALIAAINQYVDAHNQHPDIFVWSASVEQIMTTLRVRFFRAVFAPSFPRAVRVSRRVQRIDKIPPCLLPS
jgi:hypothetical protein